MVEKTRAFLLRAFNQLSLGERRINVNIGTVRTKHMHTLTKRMRLSISKDVLANVAGNKFKSIVGA